MMRYAGRYSRRGYGLGYGPGYGRGWHYHWPGAVRSPEGFKYLGPCRCGFGPHAYWQEEETGRVFRGYPGYEAVPHPGYDRAEKEPSPEELKSKLNWLKQKKEELEKRIREMEEKIE